MKARVLLLTAIMVILSSCAGFTHVTVPNSSINYGSRDFETERYVEYKLTKCYILGMGGMSARARNTNIVKELLKKANLKQNETLAYINVSRTLNTFLGLVTTVEFVASGYVVYATGENHAASSMYKDTPYKGAFQDKDSAATKYKADRGEKLVKEFKAQVAQSNTRDKLLILRKDVESAHVYERIDDKSAGLILEIIDSKLVDCNN